MADARAALAALSMVLLADVPEAEAVVVADRLILTAVAKIQAAPADARVVVVAVRSAGATGHVASWPGSETVSVADDPKAVAAAEVVAEAAPMQVAVADAAVAVADAAGADAAYSAAAY